MLFGLSTIFLHKSHSSVLNISRDFCFKIGKFQPVLLIKVLLIKKKRVNEIAVLMCDIILHKLYFVLVGRAYVLNYSVGIFVGGDGLSCCCGQFPMQHIQSCVTASI